MVASGIASVALLGLVALLPLTLSLNAAAKERNLARAAADQRLVEVTSMDGAAFRAMISSLPPGGTLTFGVADLAAPPGAPAVGTITILPAPGTPAAASALLFEVRAVCRWRGRGGAGSVEIAALYHPGDRGGGP